MNCTLIPSLKHIVLVKIGITLLNQDDIQELLFRCPFIDNMYVYSEKAQCIDRVKKELKKVEDEVLQKMLKLPLPESLKKELLGIVEALSWQLIKWRECNRDHLNYIRDLGLVATFRKNMSKFYWTPQGTIDKKKSIEFYVKDENLDIAVRYQLACEYCLENYVSTLWKKLKGWKFHKKNLSLIRLHESRSVSFWSHYVTKKLHLLRETIRKYCIKKSITPGDITHYEYMFRVSVKAGHETATRYFFQKLTPGEKEKVLVEAGSYLAQFHCMGKEKDGECFADVACFLLFNMNEEQKKKILECCPYDVLNCFLIWPRQISFMEIARSLTFQPCNHPTPLFSFDHQFSFNELLKRICTRIINNSKDYNYQKLILEFWHEAWDTHKKYLIDNFASHPSLRAIFKFDDQGNIQLILKDTTVFRQYLL